VPAKDHVFWADSTSVLNASLIDLAGVGPKNLTDVYLLSLAFSNHGKLVTFDSSIRRQSASGCSAEVLVVLRGKSE
jgi:predicted nucleic acid-binding protein